MRSVHCAFRQLSIRDAQFRMSSFLHYSIICIFAFSTKAEMACKSEVLAQWNTVIACAGPKRSRSLGRRAVSNSLKWERKSCATNQQLLIMGRLCISKKDSAASTVRGVHWFRQWAGSGLFQHTGTPQSSLEALVILKERQAWKKRSRRLQNVL